MLDRSRSFGTICGVSRYSFEQDGKYFDGNGNEIMEEKSTPPEEPVVPEDPPLVTGRMSMKKHYEARFGPGSWEQLPGTSETNKRYHAARRLAKE